MSSRGNPAARVADRIRIADIEAEISKLETSIRNLLSERDKIKERLATYRYPVWTLPNEILSEIFVQFLPAYPLCPPVVGSASPTHLSLVCRKWKEVAHGTPALWRAIPISYTGIGTADAQVEMVQTWLARSGSCPLSIQMTADPSTTPDEELIDALIPHHLRWEYAKLSLSNSHALSDVRSMPLVRHLEIGIWYPFTAFRKGIDTPYDPPIAIHHAPLLHTAILLDAFACNPDLLPWKQLTSLTLVAREPNDISDILQHTPNLLNCSLVVASPGEEENEGQSRTTLRHLQSLVLEDFSATDDPAPTHFLGTLVLPSLRRLQIPDRFFRFDRLKTFIANSGCKLQELCITGPLFYSTESYITAFPSIEQVSFNLDLLEYWDDADGVSSEEHEKYREYLSARNGGLQESLSAESDEED